MQVMDSSPRSAEYHTPGGPVAVESDLTPPGIALPYPSPRVANSTGSVSSAAQVGGTRRAGGRPKDSPTLQLEVNRLRNELRVKATEATDFAMEVRTLKNLISTKDDALEAAEAARAAAEERALQREQEVATARSAAGDWQQERKRLRAQVDAANAAADRLNEQMQQKAASAGSSSSEDKVRLLNQLTEARREILSLKDESKGFKNVLAAKDQALEQAQTETATAVAALEERRQDDNVIADLRRQLAEARQVLSNEARIAHLAAAEAEQVRQLLNAKTQELAEMQEQLESVMGDAALARQEAATSQLRARESAAVAEELQVVADRTRKVEAERMQAGGMVTKAAHLEEVSHLQTEVDLLKQQLAAGQGEALQVRARREQLLGAADAAAEAALVLEADGGADQPHGSSADITDVLRAELKEAHAQLAAKDAENAGLSHARRAAVARAARERASSHRFKSKLAELMGEFEYTQEFSEPPPSPAEGAAQEAAAAAEEDVLAAASIPAMVTQRDAAMSAAITAQGVAVKAKRDADEVVNRAVEEARITVQAELQAARDEAANRAEEVELVRQEVIRAVQKAQSQAAAELEAVRMQSDSKDQVAAALQTELEGARAEAQVLAVAATAAAVEAKKREAAREEELAALHAEVETMKAVLQVYESGALDTNGTAPSKTLQIVTSSGGIDMNSAAQNDSLQTAAASGGQGDLLDSVPSTSAVGPSDDGGLSSPSLSEAMGAEAAMEDGGRRASLELDGRDDSFVIVAKTQDTASAGGEGGAAHALQEAQAEIASLKQEIEYVKAAAASEVAAANEQAAGTHAELRELTRKLQDAQPAGGAALPAESLVQPGSPAPGNAPVLGDDNQAAGLADPTASPAPAASLPGGVAADARPLTPETSSTLLGGEVTEAEAEGTPPPTLHGPPATRMVAPLGSPHMGESLGSPRLADFVAAKVEIADLKQEVDELRTEVAAARAAGFVGGSGGRMALQSDSDEEEDEGTGPSDSSSDGREAAPRRFTATSATEGAGMTSAALANVVDRIIARREEAKLAGEELDDATLREEAEGMLRAELVRLGLEMAQATGEAKRLRLEVGSLQTAQLSAEQTAALLEEQNSLTMKVDVLSMKVAALQIQLGAKENEYAKCEDSLLRDIAGLKSKLKKQRGRGVVKSASKAVSSVSRGLGRAMESVVAKKPSSGNVVMGAAKGASPFGARLKQWAAGTPAKQQAAPLTQDEAAGLMPSSSLKTDLQGA